MYRAATPPCGWRVTASADVDHPLLGKGNISVPCAPHRGRLSLALHIACDCAAKLGKARDGRPGREAFWPELAEQDADDPELCVDRIKLARGGRRLCDDILEESLDVSKLLGRSGVVP